MYIKFIFKPILGLSLLFLSQQTFAKASLIQYEADESIKKLYHTLQESPVLDIDTRIDKISAQLLNKPYILGALGEGANGRFDQHPLYRMDGFDCETYVDTVLALALADNISDFKQLMHKIRYDKGEISFLTRNHFTDLDWNRNNQQQGFLQDITNNFHDKNNKPVYKIAWAKINKPGWYAHLTLKNIHLISENQTLQAQRLQELQNKGATLKKVNSQISYIPLNVLFDKNGKENTYLFKQIPPSSIIEIVRPNWDLNEQIGTSLNISHLGFVISRNGMLWFREASSIHGRTVDVSLVDYLRTALTSPTIKGINVQIVIFPKHSYKH